jgi:DNA-binding NarL/FixJ family response regulator
MISVLLVDDHQIVINGLKSILQADGRFRVTGIAKTISEAMDYLRQEQPDLILLDLRLPDSQGPLEIPRIRAEASNAKIIILTGHGDKARDECLRLGANEFLTKELASEEILMTASRLFPRVKSKDSAARLSDRERQVARLVAEGRTNQEVADLLLISLNTVKTHLARAMSKLQVRDRVGLALHWHRFEE